MLAITFLAFLVYDPMARSIKDNKQMAGVGFVLLAIVILGYLYIGNYGYRATVIHTGALLGTLMAANVWMRIWPAQQKIITAIRDGQAPDAALVGLAGHALAPQHLHVGAARLDDARAAHDGLRGRRALGDVVLAAGRDRDRVGRRRRSSTRRPPRSRGSSAAGLRGPQPAHAEGAERLRHQRAVGGGHLALGDGHGAAQAHHPTRGSAARGRV